jgi:16S rRNA processing protein RimM
MEAPDSGSHFYFGYVARAHGIRGEIRIQSDVDDPSVYTSLEILHLGKEQDNLRTHAVESFRWLDHGAAIVKLRKVESRNEAELLTGLRIYLDQKHLPQLEEGSFYYHDVIGFELVDSRHGPLSAITDIIELPAQDVFQLHIDGIEVLVPIVDDWIKLVDFEAGKIEVNVPEGLIDLYLEDRPPKALSD